MSKAATILGVHLPISISALKRAYKRAALNAHPDQGGDHELFLRVQAAFEELRDMCTDDGLVFSDEVGGDIYTITGKKVSDLGKGYPVTTSAVPCDSCRGLGYYTRPKMRVDPVTFLNDRAIDISRVAGYCQHCQGQGVYTKLWAKCKCSVRGLYGWRGFNVCVRCHDTGYYVWLELQKPHKCRFCKGTGGPAVVANLEYIVCADCEGVGEIELFNPVLRRGLLRV